MSQTSQMKTKKLETDELGRGEPPITPGTRELCKSKRQETLNALDDCDGMGVKGSKVK